MPLSAHAYAAASRLGAPALRLMLRRRLASGKEIAERLPERFGRERGPRPPGRLLWMHAASVGETLSALPVVAALPAGIATLFTTGTVTSARLLAGKLAETGLEGRVLHRFVPLDVPGWVARFLDHWRPDAACFVESELWPNILAACRARAIPTALINARLSARSARAWSHLPGLARHLLDGFGFIAAQSEADVGRLAALGARDPVNWGNLKLEAPPLLAEAAELARLSGLLADRPRWLAASTHPADDAIVLEAHERLAGRHPGLITAIAPRHPDRGAALAARSGAGLKSGGALPPVEGGIWVADTIGELGLLYRCFPIVLMGKSFAGGGGQNPLEPARLGCAIATGPDTANFTDAVRSLGEAGAIAAVADAASLTEWLDRMLTHPAEREAMAEAASRAAFGSTGLAERLAARLDALMGEAR